MSYTHVSRQTVGRLLWLGCPPLHAPDRLLPSRWSSVTAFGLRPPGGWDRVCLDHVITTTFSLPQQPRMDTMLTTMVLSRSHAMQQITASAFSYSVYN